MSSDTLTVRNEAAAISARLDRLPATRYIWKLVLLLSLGGCFEYYDLFFTAYIGPGTGSQRAFLSTSASFFGFSGLAEFCGRDVCGAFHRHTGVRIHGGPVRAAR